jgi:hypothetical protein
VTSHQTPGWGILLGGEPFDLEDWQEALQQPFDPWVVKTDEGLVLRSPDLDSATTSSEARDLGMALLAQANGAFSASHKSGMVRLEAVVQFLPDGSRQRYVIAALRITDARDRVRATIVATGPDGKPLPSPPPEPSQLQAWLSTAAKDDLLGDALMYFGRGESWFDIYKALECIEEKAGGEARLLSIGWAAAGEIKRLKRTANCFARHRRGKFDPPEQPMEMTGARELLGRLIARAFQ